MGRLLDNVKKQEAKEREVSKKVTNTISKIAAEDKIKDKQISAKVNEKMYYMFTKINKVYGLSNNSALNMLISKYVQEKKKILGDEDL